MLPIKIFNCDIVKGRILEYHRHSIGVEYFIRINLQLQDLGLAEIRHVNRYTGCSPINIPHIPGPTVIHHENLGLHIGFPIDGEGSNGCGKVKCSRVLYLHAVYVLIPDPCTMYPTSESRTEYPRDPIW
jgi:hypothetical protein